MSSVAASGVCIRFCELTSSWTRRFSLKERWRSFVDDFPALLVSQVNKELEEWGGREGLKVSLAYDGLMVEAGEWMRPLASHADLV